MTRFNQIVKPHVVVVGGGFGGLETARRLRNAEVRVTLIDRHNYHLFQPLLYQVATGGLSPANIATPLRSILRNQSNCDVVMAEVVDFDIPGNNLILADGQLSFDILVVAAGSTHSYFGHDNWSKWAPGLKSITDATEIRRRIYIAFEAAEREHDPEIQKSLLTFVIVGGGPTGVELAGALSEIARHTLKHDFRRINPADARIMIVEAAPQILAHYPAGLCQCATRKVRLLGIEVHTLTTVTEIAADHVRLATPQGEVVVKTNTVLWGAGVQASPLGKKLATALGVETDRSGRIPVSSSMQVQGHGNIFVIGDMAACVDSVGKPLPGLAAVAIGQGAYVARAIGLLTNGQSINAPFIYKDRGTMATIGRAAAVAQLGKYQFCGYFAWLLWLFVHLMLIVQFQNRMLVLLQWAWNYVSFNRSNRIITGENPVVLFQQKKITLDQLRESEPM